MLLSGAVCSSLASADSATVAVASNFLDTANLLEPAFGSATGHQVRFVAGSTGKLYAQILSGAPFDVLLSADQSTIQKLEDDGLTIPGTRFTYAIGRLVLWSQDTALITGDPAETLRGDQIRHLAIANPDVAPYGAAAVAALQTLGVWNDIKGRIVLGQNINDVYLMTSSGNATAGFVAASALVRNKSGSRWAVPSGFHLPLAQDAVLLKPAKSNAAAIAFLTFLRSKTARAGIVAQGYSVDTAAAGD